MLYGILLGILVGLIMGLTGAGGGILAVPALMYGMGLSPIQAKPVALIAVGLAAMIGTFHGVRNNLARYRAALVMALAGLITAPLGILAAEHLGHSWIALIYIAVMTLSGLRMLLSNRDMETENRALSQVICPVSGTSGRFIWTPITAAIILMIGAFAGFFTGLLGVGGGFIIVPALLAVSNLSLNSVVATSLMVIMLNSIITVSLTIDSGIPLTVPLWLFVICTVVGLSLGRLTLTRVPDNLIRYGFSAVSFLVAGTMLFQIIGN